MPEDAPFHTRTAYRLATAALGLLLVVVGLYALILVEGAGPLVTICGFALAVLGVESLVAAARSTRSLVSRLVPLP